MGGNWRRALYFTHFISVLLLLFLPYDYSLSLKLRYRELLFTVVVTFCRSSFVKSFCFVSFTLIEKCANANTRKSPQEPSTVQMTTVPPAGG